MLAACLTLRRHGRPLTIPQRRQMLVAGACYLPWLAATGAAFIGSGVNIPTDASP